MLRFALLGLLACHDPDPVPTGAALADDPADRADAARGFLGTRTPLRITDAEGSLVWSLDPPAGDPPASVHPGLWRQAQLNGAHGLYQVAEGVYQVRGFDLANLTLIEGREGWIVVDPLTVTETAAAALALANERLGARPVTAVLFTHSHIDHFGGVDGVLPAGATVPLVAPKGFTEEATSENVLAGWAMGRRAFFMYGGGLPLGPTGHVDTGLGPGLPKGTVSFREPTLLVDHSGQALTLDGVDFVFQYAPDTEAPAELTFYLPAVRAYCSAELATHTLHNLYTPRGAKVRDARRWAAALDEALALFPAMEVAFASHQWPVFGHERAVDHLQAHRDAYRYIHDQTLRLANQGWGPAEIAEVLVLPPGLAERFAVQGYYGTVRANAKAVYQAYFGWYDGNPANLDPLPPVEESTRLVAALGGRDRVLQLAAEARARGEERWAITLLNHLVFADPEDAAAREALAAVYTARGQGAEAGPWRDIYLSGALELREGVQGSSADPRRLKALLGATPVERLLDAMTVRVNGPEAASQALELDFLFTDVDERHRIWLRHGVLSHRLLAPEEPPSDTTLRLTRALLVRLATREAGLAALLASEELSLEGPVQPLLTLFSLLERPDGRFPLVTP